MGVFGSSVSRASVEELSKTGILKNSEQCPFLSAEEAEVTEVEWVGRHPGAEEEKILENSRSHLGKEESVKLSPIHPLELPIIKKK